jgi:peptidyl-prolyl cis-trans isomerase SurA
MVPVIRGARFSMTLFFLLFGAWAVSEAVVDRVVAVVNQEIITLSELEKWKGPLVAEIKTEDRLAKREQTREVLRKILDRLVEEKLVDQEVKRLGLKVSAKEMEGAIEELKRRNNLTQENFEKALVMEGLSLEGFKKEFEKQILRSRLINMAVRVEPKAGEKELREFYQKNRNRYRGVETYRPGQILFYIPKDATPEQIQEIRSKCQKVLDKIEKGEDFGEMAVLYSEDASAKDRGDLGYFKRGDLLPAFEKEALRLKVGETSGMIRSEFGFHIIKLLDRKGGDPPPLEEVKEKIGLDYYQEEMDKAVKQYIATLREKAIIDIKL